MAKKIKNNSAYNYNNRVVKNSKNNTKIEEKEEIIPDLLSSQASYVKRALAYAIDLVLYVPLALLLQFTSNHLRALGGVENERNATYMMISVICLALLFYGYLPFKWQGQTIGKKLLKIRVIPLTGRKIEFSRYLLREFIAKVTFAVFVIPANLIYWLYLVFVRSESNPTLLHDRVMMTKVVNVEK